MSEEETKNDSSITFETERDLLTHFIKVYENTPTLWDPNDKYYTIKSKRNEELAKMLKIFKRIKPNATRDDVRRKINTLRSNYRKELRKIEVSKRKGVIYNPKSWTFHVLQFLRKVEKPILFNDDRPQEESLDQDHEFNEQEYLETSSVSSDDVPPPKIIKKTHNVKTDVIIDPQPEFEQSFTMLPVQSNNVNPLAIVWTDKLAQLNPTQRIFAEKAINDVLFEAQLNTLHRNSVQINSCQLCGGNF